MWSKNYQKLETNLVYCIPFCNKRELRRQQGCTLKAPCFLLSEQVSLCLWSCGQFSKLLATRKDKSVGASRNQANTSQKRDFCELTVIYRIPHIQLRLRLESQCYKTIMKLEKRVTFDEIDFGETTFVFDASPKRYLSQLISINTS